jgi:hypothetical protein
VFLGCFSTARLRGKATLTGECFRKVGDEAASKITFTPEGVDQLESEAVNRPRQIGCDV